MKGPRVPLVYPKWKFKDGLPLEDIFLYRIQFTFKGNRIIGVWYVRKENSRGYYPPRRTGRLKSGARLKPVRAGKDFFYASLERLRESSLEIRSLTKHHCGGTPVSVTEDKNQTIELPLNAFKKIPLGTHKRLPVRRTRWHRIYIPSKHGGYLNISLSRGTGKLYYQDHETRAENESGKKYRAFRGSRWFKIPPDKHGWYNLKVEGFHRYRISVKFYEEGIARKKDGAPHIPWNFYWFPVNEKTSFQAGGVFWKYVDALGNVSISEDTVAKQYREKWKRKYNLAKAKYKRTGHTEDWGEQWVLEEKVEYAAAEWEKEYHYKPDQPNWAGHCHNVAVAAVYTEKPQACIYNNEDFSAEEIGFLAMEWTGNYKRTKNDQGKFVIFSLSSGGKLICPLAFYSYPILYYFKPSELVSKELFTKSVENNFNLPKLRKNVEDLERTATTDPSKRQQAVDARRRLSWKEKQVKDAVDEAVRNHGGSESGFVAHVDRQFGHAAAILHTFLQKWITEEGFCGFVNLRSSRSMDSGSPVWNHSLFKYRATMEQAPGQDDEKCVRVVTRLVANSDAVGLIGTMPAEPFESFFGGQRLREATTKIIKKGMYRPEVRILQYDLQFDNAGEIDINSRNNSWIKTTDRTGRKPLYAPSYISISDRPSSTRGNGSAFSLGNPFVDWRIVKENLIELVDKYE